MRVKKMKPHMQILLLVGVVLLCGVLGAVTVSSFLSSGDSVQMQDSQSNQQQGETVDVEMTVISQAPPPLTLETLPHVSLEDIASESPNYDAVRYMLHYGYLQGVEEGKFAPDLPIDRATMVTVLFRVAKEKAPVERGLYSDVPGDAWYADAVAWAHEAEIVQGLTEDAFGPLEPVTRGQLATVLSRFAAYRGLDVTAKGDLSAYTDGEAVAEYAHQPMAWSIEQGLFKSTVGDTILPDMPVSRIQFVHALMGILALGGDALAEEIHAALPEKAEAESLSRASHEEIQAQVDAIAQKYRAAGLQVAVVEGGRLADTYSYGWAVKNETEMTEDHKIRCASISKVMVGMSAMLLREDGIIALDESIGEYWGITAQNPYYKDYPVTVGTMLTHTSSIINAGDETSRSYESVKSKLQGSGYSKLVPGSSGSWGYNNYAFGVLGMTLEVASGKYLDDILHENLFDAMDIDAAYYPGEIQNTDLLSNIYRYDGSIGRSVEKQKTLLRGDFPGASGSPFAGGLTISAKDLGKLAGLLASDGRYEGVQLLSEESVELMETTFPLGDGSSQGMPLRCRTGIYGRDTLYYHTGSAYGVFNFFSYDPATGDGVVVLTTGTSGSRDVNGIYAACGEISQYIYDILKQ